MSPARPDDEIAAQQRARNREIRGGAIVGCRDERGRWLLIRRSASVIAPLRVCFPGGGIEPGEEPATAAAREIREELGAEIHLHGCVWKHRLEESGLLLFGFRATLRSPVLRPAPAEVSEVLWLDPAEARSHPEALPSTELFVDALEASLAAARQPAR